MTRSQSSDLVTFTEKILNGKLHFLFSALEILIQIVRFTLTFATYNNIIYYNVKCVLIAVTFQISITYHKE